MSHKEFSASGIDYWCDSDTGILYERLPFEDEPHEIDDFKFAAALATLNESIIETAIINKVKSLEEELIELRQMIEDGDR